ncbi:luciferase family oxidoreductase group 1 [Lewinella aquimaris]|uniref:Luciferase-like monooxygenase n=1 Tax=Neolewinella aquimaris TaxID=1835722 RepID=A0A840EAD5_9BACT|nr:LLM class flavin-dependent oxidoreductase [Neolewinella aquimaris]MBB4080682.1 luciferase family oxidoreductase group 1 [Neolewinella aquimaris]
MSSNPPHQLAYSVLELAAVAEGDQPADTFRKSLELARHIEQLGYTRMWVSEHHNMAGVASSAPTILIGYLAGGTTTLRVGSGGIMLPNHSPLVVAEQMGTLASLYPNRIDLGLGRAPGTDPVASRAIRGHRFDAAHDFPRDIQQLQTYFSAENRSSQVRAIPGEGLDVPIYILGSSTESAYLAGLLGLPYAFASHFAPAQLLPALKRYRENFRPSAVLSEPYVIACVNVVAADTDAEANRLATTLQQAFLGIVTGKRRLMQPPVDSMDALWSEAERQYVGQMLSASFFGSKATLEEDLREFTKLTRIDELMVASHIFDHGARLHSHTLLAEVMQGVRVPLQESTGQFTNGGSIP